MFWGLAASILGKVLGSGTIGTAIKTWLEGRTNVSIAKIDLELAEIKARTEIAAYKIKADLEWDLKWANEASASWKDEYLLVLWSIPTACLFIPPLRPFVIEGFDYLARFSPDAPGWFMAGWAVIFAASFGMKQALAFMLPAQAAKVAGILGSLAPDVPPEVVLKAQEAVDASLTDEPTPKARRTRSKILRPVRPE